MGAGAERYVSLVPSVTEALFELGVGERVVGATKFCVRPRTAVDGVTRVGGTKDPRIERILDLEPTRVFANREENRREDVEALRAAGVPVHLSFPRRAAEVPGTLRELATVVGASARGEALASEVESALLAVRAEAARRPPVRFVVLIWREPWMVAGRETYLSDLLTEAGGVNVVPGGEGAGRYPALDPEALSALSPDRILLPSEPFPFENRHRDELVSRTRIDPSTFLRCDGELLTWHGPRTGAGLRAAARWLHRPAAPPVDDGPGT